MNSLRSIINGQFVAIRVEEKEFSNSLIRVKRKKSDIRFVSGKEKEMMMMMRKDNKTTNKSI